MGDQSEILLAHVAEQCNSNTDRIEKLEGNQTAVTELAISVREIASDQGHMKTDIGELKEDVKAIAEKPAKRWDSIVDKLLSSAIAGIIGYLLAQISI